MPLGALALPGFSPSEANADDVQDVAIEDPTIVANDRAIPITRRRSLESWIDLRINILRILTAFLPPWFKLVLFATLLERCRLLFVFLCSRSIPGLI